MSIRSKRGLVAATIGLALVATPLALTSGAAGAESRRAGTSGPAKVRLLAINDFHGQLEKLDPTATSSGRVNTTPAGGAEYLHRHLKRLRQTARAHGVKPLTVAAGDLIGATPLLSAAFHDEPTIEAMNLMGLDVASVGNHEFDEGWRELKRMQNGGCLPDGDGKDNQNSCPEQGSGVEFEGADFRYLAANVKKVATGKTLFRPIAIRKVKGHKIGFIGMTLEDTPNIVTKSGVEGLQFLDEVKTANALVPKLRKKGVRSIVVLLHEGGSPADTSVARPSKCADVSGPGIEIAKALHPEIDVVVSGHTHQPYICNVLDPKGQKRLITSAFSVGRVITTIDLVIDRTGNVKRNKTVALNRTVTNSDVDPIPAMTELINRYQTLVAPIANKVIGHIAPLDTSNNLSRSASSDGLDSLVGNLITDAQRIDPSIVPEGQTTPVVAFMNPGGIRADLVENAGKEVTYGAAFAVQPFNNYDASLTLTGQDILDVLNEQWNGRNEGNSTKWKVLQVSGLKYTWDKALAAQVGEDALVGTVQIDTDPTEAGETWETVDPSATYRVAANAFLADGGDGFATFTKGTDEYIGGLDIDALVAYLAENDPYTPTALDRISSIN